MLERDEGREHKAYPDPLTHGAPWTIGIGHTGPEVYDGLRWDDAQIDAAFDADVATAERGCLDNLPWFSQLDEVRRAVLIAMCFQMGVRRLLGFVNMLAAVRDEHYAHAAEQMRQSVWARQTPKRALRMALQMETGAWQ
jgi:lysozyme